MEYIYGFVPVLPKIEVQQDVGATSKRGYIALHGGDKEGEKYSKICHTVC